MPITLDGTNPGADSDWRKHDGPVIPPPIGLKAPHGAADWYGGPSAAGAAIRIELDADAKIIRAVKCDELIDKAINGENVSVRPCK